MSSGNIGSSAGAKINFSGAWKFCGQWAKQGFKFCKEVSTKIGLENLRIGGSVIIGNSMFYSIVSRMMVAAERRFAIYEITRGGLNPSQRSIKKYLINEIFPFTLTLIFNYTLSHLLNLKLSFTAILGISIGTLALRMLFNRPTAPVIPAVVPVVPAVVPAVDAATSTTTVADPAVPVTSTTPAADPTTETRPRGNRRSSRRGLQSSTGTRGTSAGAPPPARQPPRVPRATTARTLIDQTQD